mgnify:CR=1 FL=1|tara:strand:- start:1270 stop:1530 length:261 start_codon:yes stop_codon:yes gene_type:complete
MKDKKDNVIELNPPQSFEQMKNETFEAMSKDVRGMMMFLDMIVLASQTGDDRVRKEFPTIDFDKLEKAVEHLDEVEYILRGLITKH